MPKSKYSRMSLDDLKALLKKRRVKNFEGMDKSDMISLLESMDIAIDEPESKSVEGKKKSEPEEDEDLDLEEDEESDLEEDEDLDLEEDEESDLEEDEDLDLEDDSDLEEDEEPAPKKKSKKSEPEEDEDLDLEEDEESDLEEDEEPAPKKKSKKSERKLPDALRKHLADSVNLNQKLRKKGLWVNNAQFLSKEQKETLLKAKNPKDPIAKKVYKQLEAKVALFRGKKKSESEEVKPAPKSDKYTKYSDDQLRAHVIKKKLVKEAKAKTLNRKQLIKLIESVA